MPRSRLVLVAFVPVVLAVLATGAGAARIIGTAGADVIRGGPEADVLHGLGGNDLLDGRAGRDRVAAGRGNDRVQAFDGFADSLACGTGADVAAADARDAVARDCEIVSRQISRDSLRNAESQHATEVEPHAVAAGSTIVAAFQVGRIETGGAGAIGWATSRNSGRTWRSGLLPRLTRAGPGAGVWERASDPVVAYDAAHRVWLVATLALTPGRGSALAVSRSRDGLSWEAPVLVASASGALAFDKEWIVCDNGQRSAFAGRCYLSYSDLRLNAVATRFSTDGGVSWSGPVVPPDATASTARAVGVVPVVRPDGSLVIPYYNVRQVDAIRSTDGGVSYSVPVRIAGFSFAPARGVRAPPLPTAAVDSAGTVSVVWQSCSLRRRCDGNDLVLSRSSDGIAWSDPVRVAPAAGGRGSLLIPALGADPRASGSLALTWYVLAGDRLGVRAATSRDGGRNWTRARRLDAEAMRLSWVAAAGGAMVGDYIATVVMENGRALSVFSLASARGGKLNQATFAARLP
ncbi:MAG: exo-alpha-sialidase [Actinomycetota bacterium]|nr:exo-alpha-sialidase [Actinomycetota bacterium]